MPAVELSPATRPRKSPTQPPHGKQINQSVSYFRNLLALKPTPPISYRRRAALSQQLDALAGRADFVGKDFIFRVVRPDGGSSTLAES
jgi:hypothetical protein